MGQDVPFWFRAFRSDPRNKAGTRPWPPNFVTNALSGCDELLPQPFPTPLSHFMATQMLDTGVPVPIVAGRLCHAEASTTLIVYAHAVPGGDRLAAEAPWRRVDTSRAAVSSLE